MQADEVAPEESEGRAIHSILTDKLYDQLEAQAVGQKVAGLALWEASLADDEDRPPAAGERTVFDLDVYLENALAFELYGVLCYADLEGEPLQGLDRIGTIVEELTGKGVWLDDIAATDEDELVLILSQNHEPKLYLCVGGWVLNEWDNLPNDG